MARDRQTRDGAVTDGLVVCSPIRLYRDGLAQILGAAATFGPVCCTGDIEECERVVDEGVRIVLLDMATAGSVDAVRGLVAAGGRVIALAVPDAEREVVAYAEAGVSAYVMREDSLEDLMDTLASVARGESRCSPRNAAILMKRVHALAAERRPPADEVRLTRRERDILGLLEEGLSNKEIARRLSIELPTVKNHVHNILEKLDVSRRAEAVAFMRAHRPLGAGPPPAA